MSKIFLLSVNIGIRIGGELPPAQLGEAYLGTLFGMGGIEPYQWSVSGTLPTGITSGVDSSGDLVFSGTTSEPGLFPISVTLMDSRGRSISRKFNIRVIADPLVITGAAPNGEVGVPYSYDYAITGGVPPYFVSLWIDGSYGPTPAGLTLSQPSTNVIRLSGTPTTPQATTFMIAANDSQTPVSAFASVIDTVAVASVPGYVNVHDIPGVTVALQYRLPGDATTPFTPTNPLVLSSGVYSCVGFPDWGRVAIEITNFGGLALPINARITVNMESNVIGLVAGMGSGTGTAGVFTTVGQITAGYGTPLDGAYTSTADASRRFFIAGGDTPPDIPDAVISIVVELYV